MKRILLIEDSLFIRENASQILAFAGYQVLEAEDGKIGLEKCSSWRPDLIICDMMMPGLNGMEVLQELKKDNSLATIPFIFLSAKVSDWDISLAFEQGASAYLTKPFNEQVLLDTVAFHLAASDKAKAASDLVA